MPLSPVNFFGLLDFSNPVGQDSRTISDDQHRNILQSIRQQCPNWLNVVNATEQDVNLLTGFAASGIKPLPGVGAQTIMPFFNSAPPTPGWGLYVPDANVRALTIGGTGGQFAGNDDPTNLSDTVDVTMTVGQTGASGEHTHTYSGTTGASNNNVNVQTPGGESVAENQHGHSFSGTTASNGTHTHGPGSLSGSGTASFQPRYAMMVLGFLEP